MREFLLHIFSPHPSNNHRAKILDHKILILIIGFFVFSSFFFPSALNPISDKIKAQAEVSLNELLILTNEERSNFGLDPLVLNTELTNAAGKKAEDMIRHDYWAHNSPSGVTPWEFIKGSGYNYVYAGENLARGFTNSKDVLEAWMASPAHRENILSPNYEDVGFAIKSGNLEGEETILIVQEFGSRNVLNAASNDEDVLIENNYSSSLASIISLNKSAVFVISIIFIFILVFVIDIIILRKKNVFRFVGHNFDHIIYLSGVTFFIIFIVKGSIL